MLDGMPNGGLQGEFVEKRHMPEQGADGEDKPGDGWKCEEAEYAFEEGPDKEWPERFFDEAFGEAAEHGYERPGEEQEGWREHDEQQMLCHVGGEKEAIEGVKRGGDCEEDHQQTGEEREEAFEIVLIVEQSSAVQPAAHIKEKRRQ